MQDRIDALRNALGPGIAGGLVAGAIAQAYLLASVVFVAHASGAIAFYQYVASALVGKAAYADANDAWLGIVVLFAASALWGAGYAYVANELQQLRERPFVSGIGYGVVVYFAMQLMEVAAAIYRTPNTFALVNGLVAGMLFFGVPLAYFVRLRTAR